MDTSIMRTIEELRKQQAENARLIAERDEAVEMLKLLMSKYPFPGDIRIFANSGDYQCKRILELIGEGE